MSAGLLGLEAVFSEGREVAVHVVLELLKGQGGDAAKREDLLLGVDGDLDAGDGAGGGDVAVPTDVNIAIEPRTLEVGRLVIVQLTLQLRDLSLDLALLVQEPLHARTLALGLSAHLINGQTLLYYQRTAEAAERRKRREKWRGRLLVDLI